jgi:hypothetical protein
MKIEDIEPTREILGGEYSDPQKVSEMINQIVASSYKPDSFSFSDGECVDLMIEILRLPGEDATDEECLEMIDTILGVWKILR